MGESFLLNLLLLFTTFKSSQTHQFGRTALSWGVSLEQNQGESPAEKRKFWVLSYQNNISGSVHIWQSQEPKPFLFTLPFNSSFPHQISTTGIAAFPPKNVILGGWEHLCPVTPEPWKGKSKAEFSHRTKQDRQGTMRVKRNIWVKKGKAGKPGSSGCDAPGLSH